MAKRIVPIRVIPTCVGMTLTSSFSLGRASDEVDQGVPSVAAGTHPKRVLGRHLKSERARATRPDGVYVRRRAGARRGLRLDSRQPSSTELLPLRFRRW
jgi:hypothetical protein